MKNTRSKTPIPKPKPCLLKELLVHLHIGKSGGTSLDPLLFNISKERKSCFLGFHHFDWTLINQMTYYEKVDVLTLLRNPTSRSISHFHYAKKLPWTEEFPVFRNESLDEYLHDPKTMLQTRDVWQDGMASVAWLTGTHTANWIVGDLEEEQLLRREWLAQNHTRMLTLAADRLEKTLWFGLLEDTPRSMELLRHSFNLSDTPPLQKANNANETHEPPSDWTKRALASLTPQDHWLYEYAQQLFEARWNAYTTGTFIQPLRPPFPKIPCISSRHHIECRSGPLDGLKYYL